MDNYNLCIIKPNKSAFSETFIQKHIDYLAGNKKVLYGGAFPVYDDEGKFLIKSKLGILSYLIQKRILKRQRIQVRNKALTAYLKSNNIDVVLAEYGMVGAMVAESCEAAKIPLVVHFHGADVHHRETVAKYLQSYKRAFNYASALIAVSQDMANALIKLGASPHKVILCPYGIDTTAFSQVNIAKTESVFLSVGRFVEKKSPLSLVKAFNLVSKKISEAKLVMVGDGPLFEDAKNLITQLNLNDKVTLAGVLNAIQIRELMQNTRCFVQHSVTPPSGDMEGTPLAILEASSSGLPVVSTLHAGIKEAVINNVTGYLVNEFDIENMAEKMIILASSVETAVKLGNAGRQHITKNYNIVNNINTLNKIISNSIENSTN
ncbi:glycosyltransferase involved in cell wall biosynthesis [Mucilaginibacter gracilis]|uniref:Glycosyltransferase involved in cell wall biosynthesis n=1 Tax=Mucilaginibacter gracilis TaxID=423350 RepID=A0A495IVV2_9SPHI|nr:glycosyltransferase family 4 protein [Mucilaginibacter gracilis]RKR80850.1 glycosyltransferase involved in cell wall biosynthesis [Mucilaginibacter gracilis]